jgi:hypothetical protein
MIKSRINTNASSANVECRSANEADQVVPTVTLHKAVTEPAAPATKQGSKQQQLAALLLRDEGATLDQMIAATGWLPHTTRAALTGLKKKGFAISSDKVDGVRTYRGIAPE